MKKDKSIKKYNIKDIYRLYGGNKRKETTPCSEVLLCIKKNEKEYIDVFTDAIYYTESYSTDYGDWIIWAPTPFINILNPGTTKDKYLEEGIITKKELINFYNALNRDRGYHINEDTNEEDIEKIDKKIPDDVINLTKKKFDHEPMKFRDIELEKLMISLALNKKIALITGKHQVGKTTLVEHLAYLIQKNNVPDFLKEQTILEIEINSLNTSKNKKELERKINKIIKYAKSKKAILFIDNADKLLEEKEENINTIALLRYYAERQKLKIIATTSKEINNNNYDIIKIDEPNEKELKTILERRFEIKSKLTKISIKNIDLNSITNTLIDITNQDDINEIEEQTNPGFLLNIIDTSFAIAMTKKDKNLTINHIIEAIDKQNIQTKETITNKIKEKR